MQLPIYLDHHATTPLDPRVLDAMLPFLRERFGNAASASHCFGWEAAEAIETARAAVAMLVGAAPQEVVFTSGATESDNLALMGSLDAARRAGRANTHVIVGATEHPAVLDPTSRLEEDGTAVTRLAVDRWGRVDPEDVRRAVRPETILVSLMSANNEIGTLHPIEAIARALAGSGVPFHTDAAQSASWVKLDVGGAAPGLVSLSAHKMHGPKGIGALVVRSDVRGCLHPRTWGGGQERGMRPGTPNVPGIVGFGVAAQLARETCEADADRVAGLRDRLLGILSGALDGVETNGHPTERLPNNLHLSFDGLDGEALATDLAREVAVSTGSACATAAGRPSHVLRAVGVAPERARGSIRLGLGRFSTTEEVEAAAGRIVEAVRRLRALGRVAPSVEEPS